MYWLVLGASGVLPVLLSDGYYVGCCCGSLGRVIPMPGWIRHRHGCMGGILYICGCSSRSRYSWRSWWPLGQDKRRSFPWWTIFRCSGYSYLLTAYVCVCWGGWGVVGGWGVGVGVGGGPQVFLVFLLIVQKKDIHRFTACPTTSAISLTTWFLSEAADLITYLVPCGAMILGQFERVITPVSSPANIQVQYIPRNMHTVLLCFALLWLCYRP